MRKIIQRGFIFLCIVILEAVFLKTMSFFGADLAFVILIIYSFRIKLKEALPLALYAGILKDSFTQFYFGINTFLFGLMVIFCFYLSKRVAFERRVILAVFVFFLSLLSSVLKSIFFFYLRREIPLITIIGNCFFESFANSILYILVSLKSSWPVLRRILWIR